MSRLEIWAATPTPFDPDGRLDLSVVEAQAEHLRSTGVSGAFVAGTTGEYPSLTTEERRLLLEAWADVRPEGFGLAAQVGSNDLAQAGELAAHAADHGVDFVAATAPFYGEAPRVELVVDHLARIAAAAGETPLCYYHIPSMTGSTHLPADVVTAARDRIPTLTGVKFTDEDLLECDRTRATGVKVFFGRDELLPAGLAIGVEAVIGSLYNGLAPVAHRVAEAYDSGEPERAYELHRPFREIAAVAGRHGGLGFVKELMNRLGPQAGAPRTPWGPLDAAAIAEADALAARLRVAIEQAGQS